RNKDLRSLKMMMRKAEAWGFIEKQDWGTVKQEKEPKGRVLLYSPADLKKLLRVCHGTWETIAMLASRAGLRRGEVYWLPWDGGVDFERERIHVAPVYDDSGKLLWKPKDHERRWIPMSADLKKHLLQACKKKDGRSVVSDSGERPTLGTLTTYFRRLSRKAELKGAIHTLRHTFGAHLASAGVPLHTLAKLMGHSSVQITEIYAHLAPDIQQAAIERLP